MTATTLAALSSQQPGTAYPEGYAEAFLAALGRVRLETESGHVQLGRLTLTLDQVLAVLAAAPDQLLPLWRNRMANLAFAAETVRGMAVTGIVQDILDRLEDAAHQSSLAVPAPRRASNDANEAVRV